MEATQMPTDRWMDEEDMVHIYNGTLLSYKKEHIWVNPNEVDESGAYYTEWSKSERQKQISYTNVYIWNLERWYWWTYLQGSSGHGGVRRGWDDWRGEHGNIYCRYVQEAAGGNLLSDAGSSPRSVTAQGVRWGGGGRQAQRGAPCALKAASCWRMAATNPTL